MWSFRPKVDSPLVASSALVKVDSTDEKLACVASVSVGFLCGLGAKNEEQESKTARKMAQVIERAGGGEERKETFPYPFPVFHFLVLV